MLNWFAPTRKGHNTRKRHVTAFFRHYCRRLESPVRLRVGHSTTCTHRGFERKLVYGEDGISTSTSLPGQIELGTEVCVHTCDATLPTLEGSSSPRSEPMTARSKYTVSMNKDHHRPLWPGSISCAGVCMRSVRLLFKIQNANGSPNSKRPPAVNLTIIRAQTSYGDGTSPCLTRL